MAQNQNQIKNCTIDIIVVLLPVKTLPKSLIFKKKLIILNIFSFLIKVGLIGHYSMHSKKAIYTYTATIKNRMVFEIHNIFEIFREYFKYVFKYQILH